MEIVIAGIAVLVATAVVFWRCPPVNGATHRFVSAE